MLRRHIALIAAACAAQTGCMTSRRPDDRASQPALAGPQAVNEANFGPLPDGRNVDLFTLANAHGLEVRVMTYGAIIAVVRAPDRTGRLEDVVLGFDSLDGYLHDPPYFGAVVGRYANRIARGEFAVDGVTYHLARNNGPNSLHGGARGFDKVLWSGEPFRTDSGTGVTFRYTSRDGEEGYPGTLAVRVTYTLTPDDRLVVDYAATTDKATPINLSQHTYWNLHGAGRGNILDHVLTLDASAFTPVDSTLIPTGEIASVSGTPFDFRSGMRLGARLAATNDQIRLPQRPHHNRVPHRPLAPRLI